MRCALIMERPKLKRKAVDYSDMMDSGDGVPQRWKFNAASVVLGSC